MARKTPRFARALALLSALLLAPWGCGPLDEPGDSGPEGASIGEATMKPDGTIVLQLRAESPDGTLGDGLVTYAPDQADYDAIRGHLPDLRVGVSVPIPPFPE